jgi:hypothetical protein
MNNSNDVDIIYCFTPKTISSSLKFFKCYQLALINNLLIGSCGILLTISVVITNLFVILLIQNSKKTKNIFDKILIGHALVDLNTGLFNISLKHFVDVFGYWPLHNSLGLAWAIYDLSQHSISVLHMLYISWIRLRSIQMPKTYKTELFAKQPKLIMFLFWLISIIIWTCVVIHYGLYEYNTDLKLTEYNQILFISLIICFLIFPSLISLIISIKMIIYLKRIDKRKQNMNVINTTNQVIHAGNLADSKLNKKKSKLKSSTRYTIIITIFQLQWIPCCLLSLVTPFLNEHLSELINNIINWITNTVCLTDPIVVLILNKNLYLKKEI